jgi:hypothetical protein
MSYSHAEVEAAIRGLSEAFKEAERRGSWSWLADEFYHEDCVYTCPYGGTMLVVANGREESNRALRARHGGRRRTEGWSFPSSTEIIASNHQPLGESQAGSSRQRSLRDIRRSFITYGGGRKFSSQYDLFDMALVRLCDELGRIARRS